MFTKYNSIKGLLTLCALILLHHVQFDRSSSFFPMLSLPLLGIDCLSFPFSGSPGPASLPSPKLTPFPSDPRQRVVVYQPSDQRDKWVCCYPPLNGLVQHQLTQYSFVDSLRGRTSTITSTCGESLWNKEDAVHLAQGGYRDIAGAIRGLKELIDGKDETGEDGSVSTEASSSSKRARLDSAVTRPMAPSVR
jgi:hypothetical protein